MTIGNNELRESINLAIDNAISRLQYLEGKNRWAVVNEYKEWMSDIKIKDEIWSTRYLRCEQSE